MITQQFSQPEDVVSRWDFVLLAKTEKYSGPSPIP